MVVHDSQNSKRNAVSITQDTCTVYIQSPHLCPWDKRYLTSHIAISSHQQCQPGTNGPMPLQCIKEKGTPQTNFVLSAPIRPPSDGASDLFLKLDARRPASSFPATSLCRSAPLPSKLNSDGHHCNYNHHQAWLGAETFNSRLFSTRPMSP